MTLGNGKERQTQRFIDHPRTASHHPLGRNPNPLYTMAMNLAVWLGFLDADFDDKKEPGSLKRNRYPPFFQDLTCRQFKTIRRLEPLSAIEFSFECSKVPLPK